MRGRSDICGDTFGGSQAIFGGSPLVFFVWRCVLSVGFDFVMLCNASKTVCIAFSFLFGISYRLNFSVSCRRFILALNGIPIFYHFLPFCCHFFQFWRFFGQRSAQKVGFFLGLLHKGGVCGFETVAGLGGVCRVRTVAG